MHTVKVLHVEFRVQLVSGIGVGSFTKGDLVLVANTVTVGRK